jgi:hypothetical protein
LPAVRQNRRGQSFCRRVTTEGVTPSPTGPLEAAGSDPFTDGASERSGAELLLMVTTEALAPSPTTTLELTHCLAGLRAFRPSRPSEAPGSELLSTVTTEGVTPASQNCRTAGVTPSVGGHDGRCDPKPNGTAGSGGVRPFTDGPSEPPGVTPSVDGHARRCDRKPNRTAASGGLRPFADGPPEPPEPPGSELLSTVTTEGMTPGQGPKEPGVPRGQRQNRWGQTFCRRSGQV